MIFPYLESKDINNVTFPLAITAVIQSEKSKSEKSGLVLCLGKHSNIKGRTPSKTNVYSFWLRLSSLTCKNFPSVWIDWGSKQQPRTPGMRNSESQQMAQHVISQSLYTILYEANNQISNQGCEYLARGCWKALK